ncbi:TetR/AcrR family transcriptional regulator C-terminal domain-containing protein [Undibacterium sp.]|uniref:TetR/AcrR family transcriptional regulator C-terminal domain-containing protein n=1 Tax=Undibacterium sp. TaxID=1914977 RepID=UPI00272B226D|nr:TetR/AcrR family transcriptional regulator C-terminal domain-containing protein [Undibacterium sp.]
MFATILMQLWDNSAAQAELKYQGERTIRAQLLEFLQRKMRMLCDPDFIDLARVAVAATIHAPDRAREMVERLSQPEEGIASWIRAAQADGKLKPGDPVLIGALLQGQLKSMAFWPQVAMGQAQLNEAQQQQVIEMTLEMFLLYQQTAIASVAEK